MAYLPLRASITLTASVTLMALTLAGHAADESSYQIGRWGNALLVTAPAQRTMDHATSAKLGQRLTIDFRDTPLPEAIDFLRVATKINMVIAPAVLLRAPNITLKASNMSAGNVLHWITTLSGTHSGFLHGALYISDQPIREASTTRLYDISDMTMPIRDFPGADLALNSGSQNGGLIITPTNEHTAPTSDDIAELIKKVVAPEKWAE
jgi:hypothetical protein